MPIKLKNLIGKKYRIRELTANERKELLNEQREKIVKIDREKYYFVIESDYDLFLVDCFCVRKKLSAPSPRRGMKSP